MTRLRYTEEELLSEHAYAAPQIEAGIRCHGGFDAEGRYIPPRSLHRAPAIEAWRESLEARGGQLLDADSSLLAGVRYPSRAQMKLLLREGLGQSFWNLLTITGLIEARGRVLADMDFPDFQAVAIEDIGEMALGHAHRGLLRAHGLDEGGDAATGIGGHDAMWFALRDLAFGETGWPTPQVPETIGRPDPAAKELFPIEGGYARLVYFLLNLLLIEFRAERIFDMVEQLLRDPELFTGRRAEAEHAAEMVDRIRLDERIHVSSLRLLLGEIRHLEFRASAGGTVRGTVIVDDFWRDISHWATVEQPKLIAEQQRALYRERIARHPDAERLQREFDRLEDRNG